MAITQPTNIVPSTLAGLSQGTIDERETAVFEWQVNGNSPLDGFCITIFDAYNNEKYSTNIRNAPSFRGLPFYGKDLRGNPKTFNAAIGGDFSDIEMENGYEYRYKITQFWKDKVYVKTLSSGLSADTTYYITTHSIAAGTNTYVTFTPQENIVLPAVLVFDADNLTMAVYTSYNYSTDNRNLTINDGSEFYPLSCTVSATPPQSGQQISGTINYTSAGYKFVEQHSMNVVFAKEAPTLLVYNHINISGEKVIASPDTMSSTFAADFAQEQGDTVNWVEWQIENTDAGESYSTGQVFTNDLRFQYNYFMPYTNYRITCTVESSSGKIVSYSSEFTTAYYSYTEDTYISVNCNEDNSFTVSWQNLQSSPEMWAVRNGREVPYLKFPSVTTNKMKDYGIRSMESVSYNLLHISANQITNISKSESICARYKSYTLMETTPDDEYENVYHVCNVWNFGCNIENGTVSNGNTPNWLNNFTPYRLRQPSPQKGKSGALSALLGNVNANAQYQDAAAQMEKLFNISTSENTFFLKDLKGNLYMVHTADAITQTINDKTAKLEVTVSVPWEEIGDATDAIIIQTPSDEGWTD